MTEKTTKKTVKKTNTAKEPSATKKAASKSKPEEKNPTKASTASTKTATKAKTSNNKASTGSSKKTPVAKKTTAARKPAARTKKKVSSYAAKDIQVLEGLEAVRRRPGMYVGGTDVKALHHLIYEVVDNSIDEALAGASDNITVMINEDSSVTVEDNGRGIPVEKHPQLKKPALEIVMTTLHSGAKFGGGGYKVSGGLHGVGVSAVNAPLRMV